MRFRPAPPPRVAAALVLGTALPLLALAGWLGVRGFAPPVPDAAPRVAVLAPAGGAADDPGGMHLRDDPPDLRPRPPGPGARPPVVALIDTAPLAEPDARAWAEAWPAPEPRPTPRQGTAVVPPEPEGGTAPGRVASATPSTQAYPRARPAVRPSAPDSPAHAATAGLARSSVPPPRPDAAARLAAALPAGPALAVGPATAPLGPSAAACPADLARALPARRNGAPGGSAVLAGLAGAAGSARDAALVAALTGGNLPDHLRRLVPVRLAGRDGDGRAVRIDLCVMPDYLAVGSDRDFVRVPLGLPAAQRVAARFDMLLPTARIVDAIHAQARVRLPPAPMAPGPQMASTAWLVDHNATVERQRRATGAALGALVSGHKKDVVLSARLARAAGRVAIYGWHRADGRPIQPLSTVHGQHYADYSHGVRLVARTAWLNGRAVDLAELMADPRLAGLLADDEGPLAARTLLAALR